MNEVMKRRGNGNMGVMVLRVYDVLDGIVAMGSVYVCYPASLRNLSSANNQVKNL